MTASIWFDVTVERHEPSGAFVARCADFPGKVGIGLTEAEAVADLRVFILTPVPPLPPPPTPSTGNPWADVAGTLKGHPLLDEWRKCVEEYREAKDREEEAQR
jgi:hypothetical protein